MSQFSAGYRTMERRLREIEDSSCDSETLLQSEPSSPDMWSRSSRTNSNGTSSEVSRQNSTQSRDKYSQEKTVHFPAEPEDFKRGPVDVEDGDQGVVTKEEFPDWRRSAVLTIFIFPPTGLVAMVLACLSQRSAKKGELERARRLNCCSCWLVFISLLASLFIIMFVILLRLYGYIEDPF